MSTLQQQFACKFEYGNSVYSKEIFSFDFHGFIKTTEFHDPFKKDKHGCFEQGKAKCSTQEENINAIINTVPCLSSQIGSTLPHECQRKSLKVNKINSHPT